MRVGEGCRILLVSNIPTPNNDALFTEIAHQPDVTLQVAYCAVRESNRLWTLPEEKGYPYLVLPGISIGRLGKFNPGIFRLVERFRPNVVIVTGSYTYPTMQVLFWWLSLRRIRWHYWAEELNWADQGIVRNTVRRILRSPLRRANGILAIGRRSAESFRKLGVPERKISIFHYYADTAHFEKTPEERARHRAEISRAQNVPAEATIILFMGQLIKRKGVDIIFKAFAQLGPPRTAVLLIVGDGPLRAELEALASHLGIAHQVRFVGFVEPSGLPSYTAASDAIVVASRQEGWGLVVSEAMAAGLPVVATEVTNAAANLIAHGESGFLFPNEDADALARLLGPLISDASLRQRVSQAAIEAAAPERTSVAAARLVELLSC